MQAEQPQASSTSLILRTCGAGFTAHDGFIWPSTVGATVRPVLWDPSPECGNGLHGFLYGEGSGGLADWSDTAEWIVFETPTADIVNLGDKVKCPVAVVAHVGQGATAFDRRLDAIAFLVSRGQCGMGCIGRALTGGDGSTLTGGDGSTLTGGDRSTLTGGYGSTLTGGDDSTLTGGYDSTLTGGYCSTLTGKWWDASAGRYRRRLFTVGEDGILPGVAYRMSDVGVLVKVEP